MFHKLYRINYGNGQVSGRFSMRALAERELAALPEPRGAFIERQDTDTGDWFAIPRSEK